jgi:hypothetical protein
MGITWHSDIFDDGPPIEVLAEVRFLSTAEGGKTCSVRAKYRPNHNFGSSDDRVFYIGQVEIAPGDEIAPGESRTLPIRFMSGAGLSDLLVPGREWRIQEGDKLVAFGRVVRVETGPN